MSESENDPDSGTDPDAENDELPVKRDEKPPRSELAKFFSLVFKGLLILLVLLILLAAVCFGLLYMVCGRR